ncbi:MAG: hypothetical protein WCL14_03960 [Bacteroidota bacterium]
MSINRIRLDSDAKIIAALKDGKTSMDLFPIIDCPYDAATQAALIAMLILLLPLENLRNIATSNYEGAVVISDVAEMKLKNRCSHYLQLLKFQVIDGIYTAAVYAFFGLDEDGNLMAMTTADEIKTAAEKIALGEAAMVAAGNPAMTGITAAQVAALLTDFNTKKGIKTLKADAFATASHNFDVQRQPAKTLAEDMWTQTMFKKRTLDAAAQRNYGRLWGMKFEGSKEFTEIQVEAFLPGGVAKAAGASWRIAHLNKDGSYSNDGVMETMSVLGIVVLESTQVGELFLIGSLAAMKDSVTPITILAGEPQEFSIIFVALI